MSVDCVTHFRLQFGSVLTVREPAQTHFRFPLSRKYSNGREFRRESYSKQTKRPDRMEQHFKNAEGV